MLILSEGQIKEYTKSLRNHIEYVQESCWIVNSTSIVMGKITIEQIMNHDLSKFSKDEFVGYAANFITDSRQDQGDVEQLFNKSWLHHIHNNPHHWQHWIIPNGKVLEMPEEYAAEMVADWMGASKAYTGTWNMDTWLKENWNKIVLHDRTRKYVKLILDDLGYNETLR